MKSKITISGIILILFFMNVLSVNAQNRKYSADIIEKIKQVENSLAGWVQTQNDSAWTLAERMKLYNIHGVSIAVIHNYQIEWARGYGFADVSEKRPVTEKTLFQAASISKSLNGVGVLKLVQDRKLDLYSDINNYLVTWKFPYDEKSNNKHITLASLLSHTAGLTIHGFPGYARGEVFPTLKQILDGEKPSNTEAVRSSNEPGSNVIYSGGGVIVSQMIVTDVTHQSYEKFMQKNVLDPLGMKSSSFMQPPPKTKSALLATGYKTNGDEVAGKFHIYPEQAAAGLWTNPEDLCRYIVETQLSYKGESSKVLTPEMTGLRLTPVLQESALGVFVKAKGTTKYFMHSGGNEGFTCQYVGGLQDGEGAVIMTNSDNGAIIEEIINSVATVYKWKDYYQPVIKKVVEFPEQILDKFIGKYDMGGITATITRHDKGLTLSIYENQMWKVYFTSDVDFFIKESRNDLKFVTSTEGVVTGFTVDGLLAKKIN